MTLEPGVIINHRYRILSVLGQGGMGAVYRALDLNLSVEVALKENLYLTDEYTRQFKREAAILATLRHPNLPKVTDHFEIPGQGQYLVMEFITGEDLRERMDRQIILEEPEVIYIGAAICDALTYLHTRNPAVLHRDIKPGNIRITDEGHVLLVDFGLAKLQLGTQETTSGARAMTPGYSPPEQYGTSRTDSRTDIYALGATLYAALGGAAPEDSLSRLTDFAKLTGIRTLNNKVSKKLASVLEKALELRPEDRYQSAEEMKAALLAVLGEKSSSNPVTVAPPPSGPSVYKSDKVRSDPLPLSSKSQPTPAPKKKTSSLRLALTAFLTTLVMLIVIVASVALLIRNGFIVQVTSTPVMAVVEPEDTELPEGILTLQASVSPTEIPTPDEPAVEPTDIPTEEEQDHTVPTDINLTPTAETPQSGDATVPALINLPDTGSGEIVFASTRSGTFPQIWLMSGDGSDQRQLTNLKDGACQPDWSPDGNRIAFVSPCEKRDTRYPESNIFIINTDGSNLTILDTGYGGNYSPAWSPDGTKIAFTKEVQTFTQVYMIELQTGAVTALQTDELPSKQPSWSPDGTLLAMVKDKYNTDHIWITKLADGTSWQLTHTKNRDDSQPIWTPDGLTLYYTQSSISDYNPNMHGMAFSFGTDGLEYSLPIDNHPMPSPAGDADLSTDGKWLVFESWPDGKNHDIYRMNLSGEVVIRLTEDARLDFQPSWRP